MRPRRITLVWLGLLAATAFSWEVGRGFFHGAPRYAAVVILAVAFVKIRFVILEFMELRNAPLGMRVVAEAWVVCIGGTLIALCRF